MNTKQNIIITILLMMSISILGQVSNLKQEYRNVSWIVDTKTAEIVSTLSKHYGAIKNNDSVFVTTERYNLYEDSLLLWKLTKNAYKDNDSKAKSTTIGDFTDAKTQHSNAEWIRIFDKATRDAYTANKNSTEINTCIPSTYSNLALFYAKEASYIKSYNNKRVKVYSYQSVTNYDNKEFNIHIHDTINFYIALHKTIQPVENYGVCEYGTWMPYVYFYAKPKKIVYPATINKIWEDKTGLPYCVAQELRLADERIPKILNMMGNKNDSLLNEVKDIISFANIYNINVTCDTCNVKLFDNKTEDNDVISFTYNNETRKIIITNEGIDYKVILSKDNKFYITAVSEGSLETCTVNILINNDNYKFELKKGENIAIKLSKIEKSNDVGIK